MECPEVRRFRQLLYLDGQGFPFDDRYRSEDRGRHRLESRLRLRLLQTRGQKRPSCCRQVRRESGRPESDDFPWKAFEGRLLRPVQDHGEAARPRLAQGRRGDLRSGQHGDVEVGQQGREQWHLRCEGPGEGQVSDGPEVCGLRQHQRQHQVDRQAELGKHQGRYVRI